MQRYNCRLYAKLWYDTVCNEKRKGVIVLLPKKHWSVLLVYIIMLAISALVPIGLHFVFEMDYLASAIYANIVTFVFGVIIITNLLKQELRQERREHPLSVGTVIGWTILGVFLAWGGQLIAVSIEIYIFDVSPGSANTDLIVSMAKMNPLFILLPALLGPIIEEFVFRKVIFGALYKKMNFFLAALISSLIFAVFHMEFVHILIYFSMGLVFAFVYVKTKRIIVPIIVHMTLNSITVIAQMSIDPEELERMRQQLSLIFFGG